MSTDGFAQDEAARCRAVLKFTKRSPSRVPRQLPGMILEEMMNALRRIEEQSLLRINYRRNSKGGIVSIHHGSVMIALLNLCLAAPGQLAAQSHQDSGPGMNQAESAVPGLTTSTSWLVNGRPIIES